MSNTQLNLGRLVRHLEAFNIPVEFRSTIIDDGIEVDYAILGEQEGGVWVNIKKVLISENANVSTTEFMIDWEVAQYAEHLTHTAICTFNLLATYS